MIEKNKILRTFLELVKIDSPSGNEKNVSLYIEEKLKKLNIQYVIDNYGNVIANAPGRGDAMLLSAHMDTVEPCHNICAKVKGDIITSAGDTILGADDKAGITEILEALFYLKENKIRHRPLEIIFTREEENGLNGILNLDLSVLKAREGLNIDKGGRAGIICLAAPFRFLINIEIEGKGAHAGIEPEKGVSAIKAAAEAISTLKIGRIDKETTNNIGVFQSGRNINCVPEYAHIKAEVRSHVRVKAEKQVELYKEKFCEAGKKYKAKIKFSAIMKYEGYKYSRKDTFINKVALMMKELGKSPKFITSGGGNDANVFAKNEIKMIAISHGGENQHTTGEMIRISDMVWISELIVRLTISNDSL